MLSWGAAKLILIAVAAFPIACIPFGIYLYCAIAAADKKRAQERNITRRLYMHHVRSL